MPDLRSKRPYQSSPRLSKRRELPYVFAGRVRRSIPVVRDCYRTCTVLVEERPFVCARLYAAITFLVVWTVVVYS